MGLKDAYAKAKEQGEAVKATATQTDAMTVEHREGRAERDMNPSGPKWDYKTVVLTGGFMGRHSNELDREAFEKHLDQLGSQGFELSWVLLEQKLHGEKDGHLMIFKRPVG